MPQDSMGGKFIQVLKMLKIFAYCKIKFYSSILLVEKLLIHNLFFKMAREFFPPCLGRGFVINITKIHNIMLWLFEKVYRALKTFTLNANSAGFK